MQEWDFKQALSDWEMKERALHLQSYPVSLKIRKHIYGQNKKGEGFHMMRSPQRAIEKLAGKSSTAYISYVDKEGFPVTKAMLKPRERYGIKEFWFSTNTSSNKVQCFRKNPKASIYFVNRRFFRAVSLLGTVEVLETKEAKERIWQKGDTMYYKGGVDDPDYCVLKFTAEKGRYYSNFHSQDFEI